MSSPQSKQRIFMIALFGLLFLFCGYGFMNAWEHWPDQAVPHAVVFSGSMIALAIAGRA